MVSALSKGKLVELKGLHYPLDRPSPKIAKIPIYVSSSGHQSPLPNILLSNYSKVPIRRTDIHVLDTDGSINTFIIFFRYDPCFGKNMAVRPIHGHVRWAGDMLVIQGGKYKDFVNLKGRYQRHLAEEATRCFLGAAASHIQIARRLRCKSINFPSELEHVC